MMNVAVDLAGLRLKNPVLTASGTFGYGLEFAPYGDLRSLGGFVVKGLSLKPREGNPTPRIVETAAGMLNAIGLQNIGVHAFIRDKLPHLPWRDAAVIANLYACDEAEFGELATVLADREEIAALEVNVSCPNVAQGGAAFGANPAAAAAVAKEVKRRAGAKPVIVKLSPNVTDVAAVAKAVEEAGADALCCINTLIGMAVDLKSRRHQLANRFGGLSGPAIKPVALRIVRQVCQAVNIPVVGIGGIATVDDALEFILVGATAVQVGTANFMRPDAAFRIVSALPTRLAELGAESLAAFRGSLVD